ncbi:SDR family oxidoreductase [Streptomyces californicus]
MSIVVTGATGALGRLWSRTTCWPPSRPSRSSRWCATRSSLADLAAWGVELRIADYSRPETLAGAFLLRLRCC